MEVRKTVLALSIVTLLICSMPAIGQSPEELLAMMAEYSQAVLDHDLDKVMSYYTDDVLIEMAIYPGMQITLDAWREGWAGLFQAPGWHTDHGITLATHNMVVVDHNAVMPESPGIPADISPHLDVIDFEDGKIVHQYVYGGDFSPPELPPAVPAADVPVPASTGLSPLEANVELVARWNSHDVAAVASMQNSEARIFVGCLRSYLSRGEMMAINQAYFDAIPDISFEIRRTVDMGDGWVLTEFTWKGLQAQNFMGVESMGYPVELDGAQLIQYDTGGSVTKMRLYFNGNHLLDQMANAPWSLDGIWVTSYPTPAGNLLTSTVYTAQDEAKTQYSGTLGWLNAHPILSELYPGYNPSLGISAGGQATRVGRNQYMATYLGYERGYVGDMTGIEIVGIWIAHANFELTGPDQLQGYGTVSYYAAAQDADQDGFPDDGQEPLTCAPWQWSGRRITHVTPCVPLGAGN